MIQNKWCRGCDADLGQQKGPVKWCAQCRETRRQEGERRRQATRKQVWRGRSFVARQCPDCGKQKLSRYSTGQCENCYHRSRFKTAPIVECETCGHRHRQGFSHIRQRICRKCGVNPAGPRSVLCLTCPRARKTDKRRKPTRPYYGPEYRRRRAEILADDPPCFWCGAPATTADHEPPVSVAGPHLNLVPACRKCNSGRGNRDRAKKKAIATVVAGLWI